MTYPLLRRGDRLPTVAASQSLLNALPGYESTLGVDGNFGDQTFNAVKRFQSDPARNLVDDGVIGEHTWAALTAGKNLQVIDATDVSTPGDDLCEPVDVVQAGGRPIRTYGMCNGVRYTLQRIREQAQPGRVVLLRFHGHGAPGNMGVATGTSSHGSSEFSTRFLDFLVQILAPLAGLFHPLGSMEMHGCRVGRGPDGRRLVRGLSYALNVPVTAGVWSQYGGGLTTFRFEGPTFTACPNGQTLKAWSQARPLPAAVSR